MRTLKEDSKEEKQKEGPPKKEQEAKELGGPSLCFSSFESSLACSFIGLSFSLLYYASTSSNLLEVARSQAL